MMNASISAAELHGLVDGFLEPERRADLLRRLATSSADRARVEAWQEQSDIIRNAFGGIEQEPLPAALNLAPLFQTGTASGFKAPGRAGMGHAKVVSAMILLAATIVGCWMTWDLPSSNRDLAEAPLRGAIDVTLADRVASALANEAPSSAGQRVSSADDGLTAFKIPDLEASGFSLTSAEAAASPTTLVLHYRNGRAERLVLSVARTDGASEAVPTLIGEAYSWHHRDKSFAIAGTLQPERLHDVAMVLQRDADQN